MKFPIRITEHTVEGFGGFSDKTSFGLNPDGATVLLGVNGSGKTTLLNSMYFSVCGVLENIVNSITGKLDLGISRASISYDKDRARVDTSFLFDQGTGFKKPIGYYLEINELYNFYHPDSPSLSYYEPGEYELEDHEIGVLPIYRYFQTDRKAENSIRKAENPMIAGGKYNRMERREEGYENHCSPFIPLQAVTGFFIDQINIENQEKVDRGDLAFETHTNRYLRATLNKFSSALYGQKVRVKAGASKYSSGQSLIFVKDGQNVEFTQLSSGEKYVFGIVLDIMYRAAVLNPDTDLNDTFGIVMIDEIESHLHPKWQLTILQALQDCFPGIQFIVSTHSPLIASSVRRNQIVALSGFEIIPEEELPDVYSGTSDELLDKVLHSGIQIGLFDRQRKKVQGLLNRLDFDAAEKELEALKQEVRSSPKWIHDLERRIAFGKA